VQELKKLYFEIEKEELPELSDEKIDQMHKLKLALK
jgi:hypothetical protein